MKIWRHISTFRKIKRNLKQETDKKRKSIALTNNATIYKDLSDEYPLFRIFFEKTMVSVLKEAILLDDSYPFPQLMLGSFYFNKGNYKISLEYLESANDNLSKSCSLLIRQEAIKKTFESAFLDLLYNKYLSCVSLLSVIYAKIGEFEKSRNLCLNALSSFQNITEIINEKNKTAISILVSQIAASYGISMRYKELVDFFDTDTFKIYYQLLQNDSSLSYIIKLKEISSNFPQVLIHFKTNFSIEEWSRVLWSEILEVNSINEAQKVWKKLNQELFPFALQREFNRLLILLKDEIEKRGQTSVMLSENIKNIHTNMERNLEKLQDPQFEESIKSLIKETNQATNDLSNAEDWIYNFIIDSYSKDVKQAQRVPFIFKMRFFLLNVIRNFIRIIFLVFLLGTCIPSLFRNTSLSTSFYIGLALFVISELFVDPWIKKLFLPKYKEVLSKFFVIITTNIYLLYNKFIESQTNLLKKN